MENFSSGIFFYYIFLKLIEQPYYSVFSETCVFTIDLLKVSGIGASFVEFQHQKMSSLKDL